MSLYKFVKDRKEALTLVLLSIVYLLTRLINLKIIPIFTDEAIYSYWAQVALNDPANRFISLTDGKQPLFIWLAAISQYFIADPLIATRLVSVVAGLFSLIGIYLLTRSIFNFKVAILASILYITLPFPLLYDRLGLYDSLLTMLGVWSTYLAIKMAKEPKLDLAIINGAVLGLGLITKSSMEFFLILLPGSILFFNFQSKKRVNNILKWLSLSFIALTISQVFYHALRLSPYFYIISQKNLAFIRTTNEVISNPLLQFKSNFLTMLGWLASYMGWPLLIFFILGSCYFVYKRNYKVIYLMALVIVPFLAEAVYNKVLYPRFLLFFFPYIIVIISLAFERLYENFTRLKLVIAIMFLLALVLPLYKSINLLYKPTSARLPDSDAFQFINGWPSGYGVNNVVNLLSEESKDADVNIGTEGTFGLLPYALNIYFYNNPKVHIYSFWPVDSDNLPKSIESMARKQKTYFVFYQNQNPISNTNLKLINKYQKGNSNNYMRLYEIVPR